MRTTIATALTLMLLAGGAYGQTSSGEKIVKQGNGKGAVACSTCHGPDGGGNAAAGYPRLSSLSAGYIASQLQAFRSGSRNNPVMKPIASALSDQEVQAVAKYFATQTAKLVPEKAKDVQSLQQGQQLATRGDWGHTIPACESCHGPDGDGVGQVFPALAGQHASYIKAQIEAWQNGQRKDDPNQLMQTVAKRLKPEQTAAVAAYFASLKPGK